MASVPAGPIRRLQRLRPCRAYKKEATKYKLATIKVLRTQTPQQAQKYRYKALMVRVITLENRTKSFLVSPNADVTKQRHQDKSKPSRQDHHFRQVVNHNWHSETSTVHCACSQPPYLPWISQASSLSFYRR